MSPKQIYRLLAGPDNIKARKLYHALKAHLSKKTKCLQCTSYPQYGSMIIQGDVLLHIADIANFPIHPSDVFKLKEAGLIELEEIDRNRHRIVFVPAEKEEEAS